MEQHSLKKLLKNRILWQIYIVWFFRRILPLMVVEVAVIALALQLFAHNVFVAQVLENAGLVASANYWNILKYLIKAFLNSKLITQLIVLGSLGLIALLIRAFLKSLFTYKAMWRRRNSGF